MYKKTIKECPVPLDISIKSNRKHHKTVLYSKSNKNMVGPLLGDFSLSLGDFLTETSGHPVEHCYWNLLNIILIWYDQLSK
jgi:hypothetical protein